MALWAQARVKRWCKRPPASPAMAAAMQTPPGARPSRDPVARQMVPGRPLERFGNGPPRWMTVLDRIRLTDGLEAWRGSREGASPHFKPRSRSSVTRHSFFYCLVGKGIEGRTPSNAGGLSLGAATLLETTLGG